MNKNFTPENLERFLKENADEVLMQPTDAVWNRISNRMNRRRRWVFFTSAFVLVAASLFGYYIIEDAKTPSHPFASVQTISKKQTGTQPAALPATTILKKAAVPAAIRSAITVAAGNKKANANSTAVQLFQNPMPPTNRVAAPAPATSLPEPFTTVVDEHAPYTGAAATNDVALKPSAGDPLTIESIVNQYQRKAYKRKTEVQLFFTPTISYRRLTENKAYLRAQAQSSASLAALYNVNRMVTHKPDLGLELGMALKVPITSRIKLRGGAQFNINRYAIKAFNYIPERTTITLNTRMQGGIDSVNTISSYRNFSGGRQDWLQNFYFQVSTPVGVEVALGNVNKTYFGVATTIQPTYMIGDRAYLISTDYKHYSQVPGLMRRWNVNTSAEAFVSYSTGKLRWQVGPQVRYQLLSSFITQYPVKENLFDFGMKMGVSLNRK